jgi:hypothetical protein
MGLEKEARIAALKSMGGTLLSAANMAHGVCMAQGCAPGATLTISGQSVTFVNSYPNTASITKLLQSTDGFTVAGSKMTKPGATANCFVTYNAAAPGLEPTISYDGTVMSTATQNQIDADLRVQC